jgi:hypothetical protein
VGTDQRSDQSLARIPALGGDQVAQICPRFVDRVERRERSVAEVESGGAEPLDERAVRVRDAEQLADGQRRHRQSELLPQVDRAGDPGHRVESFVHNGFDPRLQPGQSVHGEFRRDETAQPGMHRRVGHAETPGLLPRRQPDPGREPAEVVAETVRAAQHRPHRFISSDQPCPDAQRQRQPADRRLLAQAAHLGHRVEAVPEQRKQGAVRQHRQVSTEGHRAGFSAESADDPRQQA